MLGVTLAALARASGVEPAALERAAAALAAAGEATGGDGAWWPLPSAVELLAVVGGVEAARAVRDLDAARPKGGDPVHMAVAKLRAGAPTWCELRFNGTRFRAPPPPTPAGPALHNVWCETCDDHVRAVSRDGGLWCTRNGCEIAPEPVEGSDAAPLGEAPPETPKRGRGGRARKGK